MFRNNADAQALFEIASDIEKSEQLYGFRLDDEEKQCLSEFRKMSLEYEELCKENIEFCEKNEKTGYWTADEITWFVLSHEWNMKAEIENFMETPVLQRVLQYRFPDRASE